MTISRWKTNVIVGVIFSLFLLSAGCQEKSEPCQDPEQGPTFTLSDSVKEYFGNYYDAAQLIFVDSTGEEIIFSLSEITESFGGYGYSKTCESNNSFLQNVEGQSEISKLYLSSSSFIEPFYLQLVEYPNVEESETYEGIGIFYGDLTNLEEGDGLFFYSIDGENQYGVIEENLELNGVIYPTVISNESPLIPPKFKLKITKEEGIVYIKDNENGVEWFYDRKE